MQTFTRILIVSGLAIMLVVAYLASIKGYGLTRMTDPKIQEEIRKNNGSIRYFQGRSIRGGGPRYGK
ncbi:MULTISPECIES: hypothetical protein [Xanthocytophaga]|uniref:Uncharacterized protein n=2 Tax=Xanthocytophaga TaxID=3078918 RepID=A0AAE3QMM3_9BACT|nr:MULTISPECIES: hypothetical protein [Xanthocytophaga]MDJ1468786.1 hypothetical protein [Xanthocytophaga flavus]MDJ1480118.1 hypothetical protein [Xanthocytophaga flavus]MDJ1503956.1 hypothetical protein [Xanthocytophaga agilis]